MARKVVGVGSVGTRCWIVLMLGRDEQRPAVPAGQGGASSRCLEDVPGTSQYANQGQRVVAGQRLMQAASDIFLGWQRSQAGLDGTPATSTSASSGTGSASADIDGDGRRRHARCTASCAAGRWPGRTPGRATASRSPPTSAAPTSSTRRSPSSPRPTPTRTSATTTALVAAVASGRITATPDI